MARGSIMRMPKRGRNGNSVSRSTSICNAIEPSACTVHVVCMRAIGCTTGATAAIAQRSSTALIDRCAPCSSDSRGSASACAMPLDATARAETLYARADAWWYCARSHSLRT